MKSYLPQKKMVYLKSPIFIVILADDTVDHRKTTDETYASDYYNQSQVTLKSFTVGSYDCTYSPDTKTTGLRNRFRAAIDRAVQRFGNVSEVPSFFHNVVLNVGFRSTDTRRQVGFFETLKNDFYRGQVTLEKTQEPLSDLTLTLPDKSQKHYSLTVQ